METPNYQTPAWQWPQIKLRWALLAGGFFFLNALRLALTVALDLRASGSPTPWQKPLVWEMTSALVVWALIPLAQAAAQNAPWKRVSWKRFVTIHLGAAAIFWAIHVAGMWSLRMVAYNLAGWGAYDYGDMVFRAPMEGLKDLMSFAAFTAVFQAVDIRRRRQERDLAAARLESELREARLQTLSAQLDPHFLFNALNTLSAVMFDDLAKADRLLGDLGQMLRDGLEAGGSSWTMDRELAYLAHYLAFVEARFGDRVRVGLDIAAGIGNLCVPRFALQRLVENALKHNESKPGQVLHVKVEARREGDSARLAVSDDGAGFTSADPSGLGLDNLRRSLELLHEGRASLDAHNRDGGGAEVVLNLPAEASHG